MGVCSDPFFCLPDTTMGGWRQVVRTPASSFIHCKNVKFNFFRSQKCIKSAMQCKYICLKSCIGNTDESVLAGEVSLDF